MRQVAVVAGRETNRELGMHEVSPDLVELSLPQ